MRRIDIISSGRQTVAYCRMVHQVLIVFQCRNPLAASAISCSTYVTFHAAGSSICVLYTGFLLQAEPVAEVLWLCSLTLRVSPRQRLEVDYDVTSLLSLCKSSKCKPMWDPSVPCASSMVMCRQCLTVMMPNLCSYWPGSHYQLNK